MRKLNIFDGVIIAQLFLMFTMLGIIAGCGTMPTAQTQQQRLALVDVEVTAMMNAVADLREQGVFSNSTYADLADSLDTASKTLDAAWVAYSIGDYAESQDKLKLVNQMLITIHTKMQEAQQ
jgi:predicted component of type VI protein secretion system